MKVTITNVQDNKISAMETVNHIVKEAVEKFEEEGNPIEDVRLEELSATFSFKTEGSDEHFVGSVEHDGVKEMFEVNFDLKEKTKHHNDPDEGGKSFYADEDREIVLGDVDQVFEEITSVYTGDKLEYIETEDYGNMFLNRFKHEDGYEVVQVLQKPDGHDEPYLIQEYSLLPTE